MTSPAIAKLPKQINRGSINVALVRIQLERLRLWTPKPGTKPH
jgi:hypothetical protein